LQNAIGVIMGSNIGTTITVLLGAIGGVQAKKRVSLSHLVFNVVTGGVAFLGLPALVWVVSFFVDIRSHSLMGLALFHTIFNILGVLIFFPFLGLLSRMLMKVYPDFKTVLPVYLDQTPPEITDAATAALKKEIGHLLQECQLYSLRLLRIDEKLVFDVDLPFELNRKRWKSPPCCWSTGYFPSHAGCRYTALRICCFPMNRSTNSTAPWTQKKSGRQS
jgi:phosphate:Na+ symporter